MNFFIKNKITIHLVLTFVIVFFVILFGVNTAEASNNAYGPQPQRRGIHIGTVRCNGCQFTEEQYQDLARNYGIIQFAQFHANFDINKHHEAARRLKELAPSLGNPNLKIYAYINTKNRFNHSYDSWEIPFDANWLLRDNNGNLVAHVRDVDGDGNLEQLSNYIDLSNASYRQWAINIAENWLSKAPYDGVKFDSADYIGDAPVGEINNWRNKLGIERVTQYNLGIRNLLSTAQQHFDVFFNGIGHNALFGPDSNRSMLDFTDGAMSEGFCLQNANSSYVPLVDHLIDIDLMKSRPEKKFLMQVRTEGLHNSPELPRLGRYCLGSFLMGWQPGSSYFKMKENYYPDQLDDDPPEVNLNLGNPIGNYTETGNLLSRRFDNGIVYANLGTTSASVTIPQKLVRMEGGEAHETLQTGDNYTLGSKDGVFFLNYDFLNSDLTPTPTTSNCQKSLGDANCDGQINSSDFDIWKREYNGELTTKTADFNGDGKVSLVDFEVWRTNHIL